MPTKSHAKFFKDSQIFLPISSKFIYRPLSCLMASISPKFMGFSAKLYMNLHTKSHMGFPLEKYTNFQMEFLS
jgi:hypothetical protein